MKWFGLTGVSLYNWEYATIYGSAGRTGSSSRLVIGRARHQGLRPDTAADHPPDSPLRPAPSAPSAAQRSQRRKTLSPADVGIGRLFERVRDAVVVANVRGHIVLWNPAAEQLFGYAASEAVGRPVGLLIPDRLLAQHRAGFAHFARTGHAPLIDSGEPVEVPARHKSGVEVPVELSLSVLEPTAVGGRFVLAIIRDATMRKRAEAQRAELIREQARRGEVEATQRRLAFLAGASEMLAKSLEY